MTITKVKRRGASGPAKSVKRFKVIDTTTGEEVADTFVLLPVVDSAARTALAAYCETTRNAKVARFIRLWLHAIHDGRAKINKG
jgi:hypothetical protein